MSRAARPSQAAADFRRWLNTASSLFVHAAAHNGGNTPKVRFVAPARRHHYRRNCRQSRRNRKTFCELPDFAVFTVGIVTSCGSVALRRTPNSNKKPSTRCSLRRRAVPSSKSLRRNGNLCRPRLERLEDRALLAPLADIVNVTPDPRTGPVGQVIVEFTDSLTGLPSAVTGVDPSDFTLTRNGINVPLAGAPFSGSGDTYAIDLSGVTIVDGLYVLTLKAAASGIIDGSSSALEQDAVDSWVIDSTGPAADIVDISPDPRNTAVGNVTINFSEPVSGVDVSDFSLTRSGAAVSLAGLVVNGSGSIYTLNLSTVTGLGGTYVLTLHASGSAIQDADGNPLATDASDTWVMDAPFIADIVDISPDPRNTSVGAVTINFKEDSTAGTPRSVTGVDIADFTLTRNGTSVSLAGLTVGGSGATYTLNLSTVTGAAGTYVLTLVASNSGITDANGFPLASNASDTWVNDTTVPTADIVDVTPDPRTTPVGNVTINFSEAVTGVSLSDFTLTRNGATVSLAGVPLSGSGASYTLNLTSVTGTVGSYVLTLVAAGSGIIDAAGNALAANASDSWTIDDAAENNDTLGTATELGRLTSPATFGPLALVDANDWYRFTTVTTGQPGDNVSISFSNAAGDLDLELYNLSGIRLRVSSTLNDREQVSLNGLPAGTYFIRVFGFHGAFNPDYTLTINAPRPIVDDAFEQNDTRSTASNLGTLTSTLTISNLALLDGQDWYRFVTTTKGVAGNLVAINFQNSRGNLNLELYNSSGVRIGASSGLSNREQISLAGRA